MSELIFIQDMAIVMVVSAVTMVICHRLHLPVVLGYILAGLLIGPHTPPYSLVTDIHSIHTLAALGVIFLLFSIGLEFSLTKLLKVGAVAFIASTFEIIFMVWVGFSLGKLMGWKQMDSLFLGAILSISSTTIIAKILMENKKLNEKFAQVILGILVVEDLWAIVIIALLSGVATTGALTMGAISFSMIKVFIFIVGILFFGFLLVPRILHYIDRLQNQEMMVIIVLGLCFGVSLLAAKSGFSIALGAFLIGAVIAETKQGHSIISNMGSLRDMFTAIFFVSIGMLIEPAVLLQYWFPILLIAIVMIFGKVVSCSLVTFLTGHDSQTSLKVGLGLAQIGEFSFIIAQLGLDTKVTSSFLYPIAVSISALTTITTPFLMNNSGSIIKQIKRFIPRPIVTFAHFYPSWMSSIGGVGMSHRKKLVIFVNIKQYLPKFFLYTICVIAAYIVASKYREAFDYFNDSIYWSIVTLLSFPLLIGFVHTLDKMLWEGVFLNLVKSKNEIHKAKETEDFLHNTIRFMAAIASGLIFVFVTSFIIPTMPMTVLIIVLVISSGAFFWKSARRIHENVEKAILDVMDYEKPLNDEQAKSTHDQLVDLIRTNYPLSFETQDVLLPYTESAVNKTIKDLDLRSKTGASIVGIYREEKTIPNPSAQEKLLPGDVIVLIGNHEQIKAGMQFLQQKMKEPVNEQPSP
jgi:monovalent cation:H+ antiporter-2, CPA2 family